MALTPIRIPDFQQGRAIVDPKTGNPTNEFLRSLNGAFRQLQKAQNATAAALAAAGIATAAAAAANTAAANAQAASDASAAETSLVNSFVTNFTPPVIQADSAGNVTIANHDRQYGDTALNPTVSVAGDVIATAAANPDIVRIYYDDPTRAGGAVAYLFTVDPVDPPVQGGDRHVVGAVQIPAAGTSDGGYVRPPGYTAATP